MPANRAEDSGLVVRSPCCQMPARVADWVAAYAIHATHGRLMLQCGREQADPLRPVDPARGKGCGERYVVHVSRA